jgi:hypothetical protein
MTIKLGNKRLITVQDFNIPFKQIVSSHDKYWQQGNTRNAKKIHFDCVFLDLRIVYIPT